MDERQKRAARELKRAAKQARIERAKIKEPSKTSNTKQRPKPEQVPEIPTFWTEASLRFPDLSDEDHDTLTFHYGLVKYLGIDVDWNIIKSVGVSRKNFHSHINDLASNGMFRYDADDDGMPETTLVYALLESICQDLSVDRIEIMIEPLVGSFETPRQFVLDRLSLISNIVHFDMAIEMFEESSRPGVFIVHEKMHALFDYLDQRMCGRISAEHVAMGVY
jgi:hypothetical protein